MTLHRHTSLAILILAAGFQGPQVTACIMFHPNCQEDFSGMESCRALQVWAATQGFYDLQEWRAPLRAGVWSPLAINTAAFPLPQGRATD